MNKPKLNKYISLSISKDKSFLEILDSVEEIGSKDEIKNDVRDTKKTCKCCEKFIVKDIEGHQLICFQKKIKALQNHILNLEINTKLKEEEIKHDIHIRGIELLIERNNEKWDKLMKESEKEINL